MKELTLPELKAFCLGMMEDIDAFCRKNGIRYSLAYGTLIGAIRHKGFIPWDDDMDIVMLREDYEKFRATYKSANYEFTDHRMDPDCQISFGRVFDRRRTVAYSSIPWMKGKASGLWIDVFPLDRVSDDEEAFRLTDKNIWNMLIDCGKLRRNTAAILPGMPLKIRMRIIRRRLFHNKVDGTVSGHLDMIEKATREACDPKGHHFSKFPASDTGWEYIPEELVAEYTDVEFEGRKFMAFKGYDRILRLLYGDYMQLPPASAQKPQQRKYISFFWK